MGKFLLILGLTILPFRSSFAATSSPADPGACRDYVDAFCGGIEDQGLKCLIGFEDKVSKACRKAMRQKPSTLQTSKVLQTAERSTPSKGDQAD
jgi:hypothetical protein